MSQRVERTGGHGFVPHLLGRHAARHGKRARERFREAALRHASSVQQGARHRDAIGLCLFQLGPALLRGELSCPRLAQVGRKSGISGEVIIFVIRALGNPPARRSGIACICEFLQRRHNWLSLQTKHLPQQRTAVTARPLLGKLARQRLAVARTVRIQVLPKFKHLCASRRLCNLTVAHAAQVDCVQFSHGSKHLGDRAGRCIGEVGLDGEPVRRGGPPRDPTIFRDVACGCNSNRSRLRGAAKGFSGAWYQTTTTNPNRPASVSSSPG